MSITSQTPLPAHLDEWRGLQRENYRFGSAFPAIHRGSSAVCLAVLLLICSSLRAAVAQNAAGRSGASLRIQRARSLPGELVYWFVSASGIPSERISIPATAGEETLIITPPARYREAGAYLEILDVRSHRIARFPISGPAGFRAGNLLKNADFTAGSEGWNLEIQRNATARATMEVMEGIDPPSGVKGKVLRLDVKEVSSENWHAQLLQPSLDIKAGHSYTIRFWAKSDHPRSIFVGTNIDVADWHNIGFGKAVEITPNWTRSSFTFVAKDTLPAHGRLSFGVSNDTGIVDLAGMSLEEQIVASSGSPDAANTLSLNETDFRFAHDVKLPIRYRGRNVQSAQVTITTNDHVVDRYTLTPRDHGVAVFRALHLGQQFTVSVSVGRQTANFTRSLAPDRSRAYSLPDIQLPESWTNVRTVAIQSR